MLKCKLRLSIKWYTRQSLEKTEWQSRIDNLKKLATHGTQYTGRITKFNKISFPSSVKITQLCYTPKRN